MTDVLPDVLPALPVPPAESGQSEDHGPTPGGQSANTVAPTDLQLHEAATVEPELQADSDDANDSTYEDYQSRTTSVTSSIFLTLDEYGHRYHRDGRSILPADETEKDRIDLQHYIWYLILEGELLVTKLPKRDLKILDVGTGTGIWPIELGDLHPEYEITGVDQSPIQPGWVPPNVSFEIDDVTSHWLNEDNSLDFIHVRSMAGSIRGDADWERFLAEAFRILKPGGTIEVSDFTTRFQCDDGTLTQESVSKYWEIELHNIAQRFGIELEVTLKMRGWLENAGFGYIDEIAHKVPVGPWPRDKKLKEIGQYHQLHMLEHGFENYSLALFGLGGWNERDIHILLARLRAELKNPRIHTYAKAVSFMARKPESPVTYSDAIEESEVPKNPVVELETESRTA